MNVIVLALLIIWPPFRIPSMRSGFTIPSTWARMGQRQEPLAEISCRGLCFVLIFMISGLFYIFVFFVFVVIAVAFALVIVFMIVMVHDCGCYYYSLLLLLLLSLSLSLSLSLLSSS